MERIELLRELRSAVGFSAAAFPDEQAVKIIGLYPQWKPDTTYKAGDRVRGQTYPDRLYKCLQGHTSQASWEPDVVPALWAVIDETHAGTIDDPIPAARGMEYTEGLYYLDPEDGKTYLCTRSAVLQYLPHELIGQYFTEATA